MIHKLFKFQTVARIFPIKVFSVHVAKSYIRKVSRLLSFSSEVTDSVAEDNNPGNFCRRISTTSGSVNKVEREGAGLRELVPQQARLDLLSWSQGSLSLSKETLTRLAKVANKSKVSGYDAVARDPSC